jgi:hypothetical protein
MTYVLTFKSSPNTPVRYKKFAERSPAVKMI